MKSEISEEPHAPVTRHPPACRVSKKPGMSDGIFAAFRDLIYAHSGISLGDKKKALLCARLGKRMHALGIPDYAAYLSAVRESGDAGEIVALIDAVSTNVTAFFREPAHFGFLADAVYGWFRGGQRRFRFWSAGCSTGEEAYSISMALHPVFGETAADWKILATDISMRALAAAKAGSFKAAKLESMDPHLRRKWFERGKDPELLQVADALKKRIVFRKLNLSTPPFPMKGPLDAVFCRNVMIYFDNGVRARLLGEIFKLVKPGGYLMVGHAESLTGMMSGFKAVKPALYRKPW